MKVGIFTDPHINKKVQQIQSDWEESVLKSFEELTNHFRSKKVDMVICGGDFFDKALIEARSLKMIMVVLKDLDSLGVPVYFDLGNHEIESEVANILEFLDIYDNLFPVTVATEVGEFFIIPYSEKPADLLEEMKDKIVITHHDIYGSTLAAGRSKAMFGIDPKIFSPAKLVLNGHIHSRSNFLNVKNIGSFLSTAQGELKPKQHPRAYILDTDTLKLEPYENIHSLHFITCDASNLLETLSHYEANKSKLVVRYEYTDEKDIEYFEHTTEGCTNIIRHNLRRLLDHSAVGNNTSVSKSLIDVPSVLQRYVQEDIKLTDSQRDRFINIGKTLLDKGRR